jgi:hypothetical protein
LSAALQELLARLQLAPLAQRRGAVAEAGKLATEQLAPLYATLLERASRNAAGPAMDSALELAAEHDIFIESLAAAMESLPLASVPAGLPLKVRIAFKEPIPRLEAVFDRWARDGSSKLKDAVARARRKEKS